MKKLWLYKFVLVGLFVVTLSGCKIVMEYRMDDCDPTTTIVDSSDTANDAALKHGSGNTDGLSAQYSFDSSSDDGYVVCANRWFRGEGYNADPYNSWYAARYYIEAPDHDDISPLSAQEMTLSGWFKTSKSNGTIISKAGDSSNSREYRVFLEGGTLKVTFWNQYGSPETFTVASSVADNAWHAFAITARIAGKNLDVKKYLDDDYIGNENRHDFKYCTNTSGSLYIGAMNWGNGNITDYLDGYIDELLMTDDVQHHNDLLEAYQQMKAHKNGDGSSRSCACVLSPLVDYRMDECEWDGTSGEVVDSSGNDHHATSSGAETLDRDDGLLCRTAHVDGTNYIDAGAIDYGFQSSMTVMAWVKWEINPADQPSWANVVTNNSENRGNVGQFWLQHSSGNRYFEFAAKTTSRRSYVFSKTKPQKGVWYHVTGVYTGDSLRIYVNGVFETERSLSGAVTPFSNDYRTNIGRWAAYGGSRYFPGNIDEVKIFSDGLTDEQVTEIYKNEASNLRYDGSPVECDTCGATLLAEYRLDSCSLDNGVVDSSGHGHDGTVVGDTGTSVEAAQLCRGGVFDGDDDYVEVPHSTGFFPQSNNMSFSAWVLARENKTAKIIQKGDWDGHGLGQDKWKGWFVHFRIDGSTYSINMGGQPDLDTWYFITGVYDGNEVQLYVNGALVNSKIVSGTLDVNSRTVDIGAAGWQKRFNGYIDEVQIFDGALSSTDIEASHQNYRGGKNYDGSVRVCNQCSEIDHFELIHDGYGLTCQAEQVVLKACANTDCSTMYVGEVKATLADLGWSGGATQIFNFPAGSTGIPLQLHHTTAEAVELKVLYSAPEAAQPSSCTGGINDPCTLIFSESGFLFDQEEVGSCEKAKMTIQAVQKDEISNACVGLDGFANRKKVPVRFWANFMTPDTGLTEVEINGDAVPTFAAGASGSEKEYLLDFDEKARTYFSVVYDDAGKMQLSARYKELITADDGSEQTLVVEGADTFIRTPAALAIYSDEANSDCVSADASCSAFKKAGEVFALKVRAVCGPLDNDLSDNQKTPNFRFADIDLKTKLVAPVGGVVGSSGVTSFTLGKSDLGEVNLPQTVSEVGVFSFATPSLKYLQRKDGTWTVIPEGKSANIGRFTPDHFVTSITGNGVLQDACTGFTYSGQAFTYAPPNFPEMLITATGSGGNTTVNYQGDFVKLTSPATQINMPAVTADSSQVGALANPLALTWVPAPSNLVRNDDGTLIFTLGTDQFTYTREANALVAPFTSDIQLPVNNVTDSDGIAAADLPRNFVPTGTVIRYGRMQLQNAYGPETLPLTIPVRTEYYNGTGFVINNLDICTTYNSSMLLPVSPMTVGAGETTASGTGTLLSGLGNNLSLSSPGAGNVGTVDLEYDLDAAGLEWLKPGGNNPTAKATFGIFKGNSRLIYMRESVW